MSHGQWIPCPAGTGRLKDWEYPQCRRTSRGIWRLHSCRKDPLPAPRQAVGACLTAWSAGVVACELSADYSQVELHPGDGGHVFGMGDIGLANGGFGDYAILTTATAVREHPAHGSGLDEQGP